MGATAVVYEEERIDASTPQSGIGWRSSTDERKRIPARTREVAVATRLVPLLNPFAEVDRVIISGRLLWRLFVGVKSPCRDWSALRCNIKVHVYHTALKRSTYSSAVRIADCTVL